MSVAILADILRIGRPVALEWLRAEQLDIDYRYQRETIDWHHVARIADTFDDLLLGWLVVSHRNDGLYYVIDGQHRLLAIRRLGWDERAIPCFVYENITVEEESHIFSEVQALRKNPKPNVRFKARLFRHQPAAVELNDLVETSGFKIALTASAKPGEIGAISALEWIYEQYRPGTLEEVLSIARGAWTTEADGINGSLLKGIAQFVKEYRDTYDRDRLVMAMQRRNTIQFYASARGLEIPGTVVKKIAHLMFESYNAVDKRGRLKRKTEEEPESNE